MGHETYFEGDLDEMSGLNIVDVLSQFHDELVDTFKQQVEPLEYVKVVLLEVQVKLGESLGKKSQMEERGRRSHQKFGQARFFQ